MRPRVFVQPESVPTSCPGLMLAATARGEHGALPRISPIPPGSTPGPLSMITTTPGPSQEEPGGGP